jgi:hypothetical protein
MALRRHCSLTSILRRLGPTGVKEPFHGLNEPGATFLAMWNLAGG